METTDSLDTNLVIRYIIGDNAAQRIAVKKLLATPYSMHRLEFIAIAEVVYVLDKYYKYTREEIYQSLQVFLTAESGHLNYDADLVENVFPFYVTHPKLSFDDCFLATLAEKNHATPLLTFDKKLARQHPSAKLVSTKKSRKN